MGGAKRLLVDQGHPSVLARYLEGLCRRGVGLSPPPGEPAHKSRDLSVAKAGGDGQAGSPELATDLSHDLVLLRGQQGRFLPPCLTRARDDLFNYRRPGLLDLYDEPCLREGVEDLLERGNPDILPAVGVTLPAVPAEPEAG